MKSLKLNFIYQTFYRILLIITPLITSPYLSRALGVQALGQYSNSQAFSNYFTFIAMLGIETYGTRCIAKVQNNLEERSSVFWNIYTLQVCTSVCSLVIYYFVVFAYISVNLRVLYALQGLWIVHALLDINWLYFGCEEFKLTVTRNVIIKILTILCIIIFVNTPEDLIKYIIIMTGSFVLSDGILWLYLPKFIKSSRIYFATVKKHLKPALVLFVPIIASTLYHVIDKTMLNWLSDGYNSGCYYNAEKLINIPMGIISGMCIVMLPRITSTLKNREDNNAKMLLEKSGEVILCFTAAISFGLAAISDDFIPFFFGEGYDLCINLVKWFSFVLIAKCISEYIRFQYLIPYGKEIALTVSVICGAVVNVFANMILIKRYGALGAVVGTLLAELTALMIQGIFIRNDLSLYKILEKNYLYVVFGLLMWSGVYLLRANFAFEIPLCLVIQLVTGGFIYLSLCGIYWAKNKKSVFAVFLKSFLRRM